MGQISSSLTEYIKKVLGFKYTFLCQLYLFIIVLLSVNPISKPAILNVLSFVFVFHLASRIKYTIIPAILLAIPLSFDAFFAFMYRSQIGIGNIASFIETNSNEFEGVMGQLWLPATIIFLVTLTLIYLSIRELKKTNISAKISLVFLLAYLLIFIPAMTYRKAKINTMDGIFWQQPTTMLQSIMGRHVPLMYNSLFCYAAYKEEMNKLKEYSQAERALPEGITLDKERNTPEKIYLVFGESAYRKHFSLYGYEIKTTPFLDSLNTTAPSVINYYEAISPANLTRNAIRLCLTFSTPQNMNAFYTEKSIIDIANYAGYETAWLTNLLTQFSISDSYAAAMQIETNTVLGGKTSGDLSLVVPLQKLKKEGRKQFFLIHQDGSHFPYNTSRYDSIDAEAIKIQSDVSYYDRTIHHTDRLLREVYKIASQDKSAIIYYISDHGETVNESHGFLRRGTDQFEVPLVTINLSDTDVAAITAKYVDPETKYINGLSTIYILSEIMGYDIADATVDYANQSSKYIYQVNGKAYLYKDVENNNVDY